MAINLLNSLYQKISQLGLDAYLIPSGDEWQNEYVPEHLNRLKAITGFAGSNGLAIVAKDKKAFFTDGRYSIQAKQQLSADYEILPISIDNIVSWLKDNLSKGSLLGVYGHSISIEFAEKLMQGLDNSVDLVETNDLVGAGTKVTRKFFSLSLDVTGEESIKKVQRLWQVIQKMPDPINKINAVFVANPASICWILNIRGYDVPFNYLVNGYLLIVENQLVLFTDSEHNIDIVAFPISNLEPFLLKLGKEGKRIGYCKQSAFAFKDVLENYGIEMPDIIMDFKSCKNRIEIQGFRNAHLLDGIAHIKFLYWLHNKALNINECDAADKFLEFRKLNKDFISLSFSTISAYAENGAIVHYSPDPKNAKLIGHDSLYLVDSGGHYSDFSTYAGTTDVTRTLKLSEATEEEKYHFTLVLKGHINLAISAFNKITGAELDQIARKYIREAGFDYSHGTGHGVGHMLSVHEGPFRISPNCDLWIKEGMILSNEPGLYIEGKHGIRIENLMCVVGDDRGMHFETLTQVPIDSKLINYEMLEESHKKWLYDYHNNLLSIMEQYLSTEEFEWLKDYVGVRA